MLTFDLVLVTFTVEKKPTQRVDFQRRLCGSFYGNALDGIMCYKMLTSILVVQFFQFQNVNFKFSLRNAFYENE